MRLVVLRPKTAPALATVTLLATLLTCITEVMVPRLERLLLQQRALVSQTELTPMRLTLPMVVVLAVRRATTTTRKAVPAHSQTTIWLVTFRHHQPHQQPFLPPPPASRAQLQ